MYRSADLTKWEDPAQDYRFTRAAEFRAASQRLLPGALRLLKGIRQFKLR